MHTTKICLSHQQRMPHDREINVDVCTIDWMVSSMVYAVVDSMVDFDVNSRLELWKLEIIDAHTQARFVYRFKNLSNGWRRGRLRGGLNGWLNGSISNLLNDGLKGRLNQKRCSRVRSLICVLEHIKFPGREQRYRTITLAIVIWYVASTHMKFLWRE